MPSAGRIVQQSPASARRPARKPLLAATSLIRRNPFMPRTVDGRSVRAGTSALGEGRVPRMEPMMISPKFSIAAAMCSADPASRANFGRLASCSRRAAARLGGIGRLSGGRFDGGIGACGACRAIVAYGPSRQTERRGRGGSSRRRRRGLLIRSLRSASVFDAAAPCPYRRPITAQPLRQRMRIASASVKPSAAIWPMPSGSCSAIAETATPITGTAMVPIAATEAGNRAEGREPADIADAELDHRAIEDQDQPRLDSAAHVGVLEAEADDGDRKACRARSARPPPRTAAA